MCSIYSSASTSGSLLSARTTSSIHLFQGSVSLIMRSKKDQQISEAQSVANIDSRLSLDVVGRERALTQAEDSESLIWIVLDLVIDFPKLALMSLLTSVSCWFRKKRQHYLSDEFLGGTDEPGPHRSS